MIKKLKYLIIFTLIFLCKSAFGQYSGTYTVGGQNPDFPRLDTAFKWLAAKGVNGSVRLNVRSGVYSHRTFIFKIKGASLTNNIKVAPDPANTAPVIFQNYIPYTNAYFLDFYQGFISFDSIEFKILRPGAASGRIVGISDNCENLTFNACKFTGTDTTGGGTFYQEYFGIFYKDDYIKLNNLSITNCTFIGGIDALNFTGTSTSYLKNIFIKNNKFYNKPNSKVPVQRYGICLNYVSNALIEGNLIDYPSSGSGIVLLNDSFINVKCNHIYTKSYNVGGLYLGNVYGSAARPIEILNNSISNNHTNGSTFAHATVSLYDGTYYRFCNNTIYSYYPQNKVPDIITSLYLNFASGGKKNIVIKNNNIINLTGCKALYLGAKTAEGINEMDYNNYYTAGPYLAYLNSDIRNLSSWQKASAFDSNSRNIKINFKSLTDLKAIASDLDSAGTPLSYVTNDIDLTSRNTKKPDIGAYEFRYFDKDISIVNLNQSDFPECGADSISPGIIIKNNGLTDQSNFEIGISIKNEIGNIWTRQLTYSTTLKAKTSDTIHFEKFGTINGGTYKIQVISRLNNDEFPQNDSGLFIKSLSKKVSKPTATFDTICSNISYQLGKSHPNNSQYRWYSAITGGILIADSKTLTVKNLKKDTAFYVTNYSQKTDYGFIETTPKYKYYSCLNYRGGFYIEITPKTDIIIDSIGNFADVPFQSVAIYFKRGTFAGYENSPKSWTRIDSISIKTINNYTISNFRLTNYLKLKKDTIYAFYINTSFPMVNENSTVFSYSNAETTIKLGGGNCGYFGKGTFFFPGKIHYSKLSDCETERVKYSLKIKEAPIVNLGKDTSYCALKEDTLVLNASTGYAQYLWSTKQTTSRIKVTNSGTYSVKVTNNTCTTLDTIVVNKTLKSKFNIGRDTFYCAKNGINITLNAGPGYNSYQWNTGANTQTLNVKSNGVYTVKVIDKNNCQGFDTLKVLKFDNPLVNFGPDTTFCAYKNDTLKLNAGSGYKKYLWSTFATTPILFVTKSGTYSVVVTDSNNCKGGDTLTIDLKVKPQLNLGNDTILCGNVPISKTLDAGAGNKSYSWSTKDTTSKIIVKNAGSYHVTVSSNNGCIATDTITIKTQAPSVSLGPDRILNPDLPILEILDAGSGYKSYKWSTGSTVQTTKVTQPGFYTVVVTDALGCAGFDTIEVRYWKSGNVGTILNHEIHISPNPSNQELNISSENFPIDYVEVFDIQGRLLKSQPHFAKEAVITTTEFANGLYILAITLDGATTRQTFIVKH